MNKCKWCQLTLEAMSCGLNWLLMLQKREIFRACFAGFDCKKVAGFTEDDINRAMEYPGMIKSRRKIEGVISNAKCFMQIQQEFGSFDNYLWGYSEGKTYIYQRHLNGEWLTRNELSDLIAADLKKRGFKFLGSTLIYSYLQSVGIINDHAPECWMFEIIGGTIV